MGIEGTPKRNHLEGMETDQLEARREYFLNRINGIHEPTGSDEAESDREELAAVEEELEKRRKRNAA